MIWTMLRAFAHRVWHGHDVDVRRVFGETKLMGVVYECECGRRFEWWRR